MSISNLDSQQFKTFDSIDNSIDQDQIFSTLPDKPIYTKIGKHGKKPHETGWNKKKNLLTPEEAKEHIEEGGNFGIALGKEFDGRIFVTFDIEKSDVIDYYTKSIIDSHAILKWKTPHGGMNRLVAVSPETYELIDSFSTKIKHITDNDSADLEFLTNNHSLLPPSEINHSHCNESKDNCPGIGFDEYTLESINASAFPMSIEAVRQIADSLEIEPEEEKKPYSKENDRFDESDIPSPKPSFDKVMEEWKNVPSVEHSFEERKNYMMFGDWKGQEEFIKLYNGNFENMSGSNVKGRAECRIASKIGFFFGRNETIIRFFMDMLPFDTDYQKYPQHRKYALESGSKHIDWCYSKGVSFECKLNIAFRISINECTNVQELEEITGFSEKQIQRVLPILKAEGVINSYREGRKTIWENEGITEGYLENLYDVCEKYEEEDESLGGTKETLLERTLV